MDKLTQLGGGYSYYAGWDEDDSTWTEKCFDDWFGKRIRTVKWNNAEIDDLSVLKEIDNLQEVFITDSQIADLSTISEVKSVRLVELTGSNVTDLTPLLTLPNLEYLNLHRTPLTDEQVDAFAKANPDCRLLHPSVESD